MWDTPGILAGDLRKCKDFATHWLSKDALQSNPQVCYLVPCYTPD